jgi:ATP-binding cassette subfamily B protein
MGYMGHSSMCFVAIVGGALAIGGVVGSDAGNHRVVPAPVPQFLPAHQHGFQQDNSIIMALAGAERIFKMMEEERRGRGLCHSGERKFEGDEWSSRRAHHNIWPGCTPGEADCPTTRLRGVVELIEVDFGYSRKKPGPYTLCSIDADPAKDRIRGCHRRGKDDDHEYFQTVLRHRRRQDPL